MLLKILAGVVAIYISVTGILPFIANTTMMIPPPIDVGKFSLLYKIVHILMVLYLGSNSICYDLLFMTLLGLCIAQQNILEQKLLHVYEEALKISIKDGHSTVYIEKQILKHCVILHQTINRFVGKLSIVLSFPLFLQYTCGCFLICSTILQLTILLMHTLVVNESLLNYLLFIIPVPTLLHFRILDKFVCYLGSWANYRNGNCRFTIEDINPDLCTHIIYGFVGINNDGTIRIMDSWLDQDDGLGALRRFTGLKKKNPNLQTLVAIGGWSEGSVGFSKVVSNANLRATFISNTIAFLEKYGFDGFDLDWEYPSQRDGSATTDKANFSKLLAEFRTAFNNHTPRYLLTAAVAASRSSVDLSYEVPQLSKYLDFINVMTYDLHGAWETVTGHNAPLYPRSSESGTARTLNVDSSITGWIERGASPEKLILGIPTYGRSFTVSGSNKGLNAPASGPGTAGSCTGEAGYLGYNEICQKLAAGGWTKMRDSEHKVPYTYNGNQWIGYDDVEAVTLKVEYAKSKGLGGAMIWSFETDDFKGLCGTVYPLSNAIKKALVKLNGIAETYV
ncbi:chitinase [Holotrichia oblita]|uniref:Chitinase n=1 Tax=Holotrichia oblita TaxID=644536 RepID=A0ACB9TNE9_HOLOL|nr:chitinase [Holotrichia oblita]